MAILPTVSVSLKAGDSRDVIIINAAEFDPAIHVRKPSPRPKARPIERAQPAPAENEGAVDITQMTVPQARRFIREATPHALEAYAVAEESGRARKGVIAAIEKRKNEF